MHREKKTFNSYLTSAPSHYEEVFSHIPEMAQWLPTLTPAKSNNDGPLRERDRWCNDQRFSQAREKADKSRETNQNLVKERLPPWNPAPLDRNANTPQCQHFHRK